MWVIIRGEGCGSAWLIMSLVLAAGYYRGDAEANLGHAQRRGIHPPVLRMSDADP